MSKTDPPRDERDPTGSAGYSRREVLRLLGAAGAVAGLDRMMPARWLAPRAAAVAGVAVPAAPAPVSPSLTISNLSFAWGLTPYDSARRATNASYYCDGNASFVFNGLEASVTATTLLLLNTTNLGPLYDAALGQINGSQIDYYTPNSSGRVTLPLPAGTIAAGTPDTALLRIETHAVSSNTLVEEFLPSCGQTTLAKLGVTATDGCLIRSGANYLCEQQVSFAFSPQGGIDSGSLVRLIFNGNILLNWVTLASLNATVNNSSANFATLLPAGQQGPLQLTMRNTYGFETNTLIIQHSTADCGPGLSPLLYGPLAYPTNGTVQIAFNYSDQFDYVSNASLITAWLGSPNGSPISTLLNGVPLAATNGSIFVTNSAVFPWEDDCTAVHNGTALLLNSAVGNGFFFASLPETNLVARAAETEEVTVNFFLTPPTGSGKSNTLDVTFEPTAVTLADLNAAAPAGGLAGALGAAALGAASLWARFRAAGDEENEDEIG